MPLPSRQIIHIGLEVFDNSGLVCGCEVGTRVTELEGADGAVVGLENGFEVEGETIPKSEFATG